MITAPKTTRDLHAWAEVEYLNVLSWETANELDGNWRDHLLRPEEFDIPAIRAAVEIWNQLAGNEHWPKMDAVHRELCRQGLVRHSTRLIELQIAHTHDGFFPEGTLPSTAALVRELGAKKRQEAVIAAAHDAAQRGKVVDLVDLKARLEDAGEAPGAELPGLTQHALVELAWERYSERSEALKDTSKRVHIVTTIEGLDAGIGPIERGSCVIVGARPSAGKSALGLRIARGNAFAGFRTEILSLEDPLETWAVREVAAGANVSASNLRMGGTLKTDEVSRLKGYFEDRHEMFRVVDCRGARSLDALTAHMRRAARRRPIDIFEVDYVQLVKRFGAENRRTEVEEAAAALKVAAAQCGAILVLFSQLKRHGGDHPTIEHLKEAGALEEQAETILLLHRHRSEDGDTVYCELAKNKNDHAAGTVYHLEWNERSASFGNATPIPGGWGATLIGKGKGGKKRSGGVKDPSAYADRHHDPREFDDGDDW